MVLTFSPIQESNLSSMHAILSICGEHMFRTQGMAHWYPFRDFERYQAETSSSDVYAIYDDVMLVGTFYVTPKMRPWYADVKWKNSEHKALYFGGFGVLPLAQGRGIGKWTMKQVDTLSKTSGYDTLRFDSIANNPSLLKFYDTLGYQSCGLLATPRGSEVMTYERVIEELS